MLQSYLMRVFLVPAGVMLAVQFGGAYGTGREAVEFITKNGPAGGLLGLAVFTLIMGGTSALCFELARKFKAYDYRIFVKVLLGRWWFLYEICLVTVLLLAISVCGSVCGNVLEDQFGIAQQIGTLLMLLAVVMLCYWGRNVVEETMTFSSIALIMILIVFLAMVLMRSGGLIVEIIASSDPGSRWWISSCQYGIFGASCIPLLLYCARGFQTRTEALCGGLFAGILTSFPAAVFHIVYLSDYPAILDKALPVYYMIGELSSPVLMVAYILILFVMVVQTAVGMMQGLIERIDTWRCESAGAPFNKVARSIIAATIVVISWLLSKFGIITLIAKGYGTIAWCFAAIFFLPVLTIGVYKAFRGNEEERGYDACDLPTAEAEQGN
jgi:uncharacterized membrane protein YkvI